jgi:maltooligosyltrehalose trehalohydrolase
LASDSTVVPPSSDAAAPVSRRLPIGAECLGDGRAHLRVWAPAVRRVDVIVEGRAPVLLLPEEDGYFAGVIRARAGDRYRFRLGGAEGPLYPDPASRFQPEGPHGPSQIVNPRAFEWTDAGWRGATLAGQVIYELHVGTFTPEGTFAAAMRELPELARLGITTIELMPLAEFHGRFGWGYDGVDLYAPSHLYGTPDDLRRFVDAAHAAGVAVILDVVYNHFGPVGNYLRAFSPEYFSDRYENEWGEAINFDGPDSGPVREFFIANAGYWIDEFHLDGLRLDATQQIFDRSPDHILAAVGRRVREAAQGRPVVLIAENEPQDTRLIRPLAAGGYGLDGLWNDDWHHSAMVACTGRAEAYYTDTRGDPQEFISAAKYGYLFQGQFYSWQHKPRGAPAWGIEPSAFVVYLQNHDQVANSTTGARGHMLTHPGRWRAMTALLLLGPSTPMLFQGQEFQSSARFLYFADFDDELADAVRRGRAEFLAQFVSAGDFLRHGSFADPASRSTFDACKLDFRERESHRAAYALHQDLLRMRRDDEAFRVRTRRQIDGCVLSPTAFALRFFAGDHRDDRVLIVNLGVDLERRSFAEPLVAPPADADWVVRWSSEAPEYGGGGTAEVWPAGAWRIPGETAIVLAAGPRREWPQPPRVRRTA